MDTCLFCHEVTSGVDFCGEDCYEGYKKAEAELRDCDQCRDCGAIIASNGDCDCEPEDEEAFEMGERMDYNEDFGYDPYAGGPEMDDPMDYYETDDLDDCAYDY